MEKISFFIFIREEHREKKQATLFRCRESILKSNALSINHQICLLLLEFSWKVFASEILTSILSKNNNFENIGCHIRFSFSRNFHKILLQILYNSIIKVYSKQI